MTTSNGIDNKRRSNLEAARYRACASRDEAGSVMVELALLLPVLTLLLLGAMDFSRVFFYAVELGSAVTAGAEYGARNTDTATNYTAINSTVTGDAADLTGVSASSTSYCSCPGVGGTVACTSNCTGYGKPKMYVSVTGNYTWTSWVNWPGIPHSVALTRTVYMRAQ